METISLKPIGIVRSSCDDPARVPIEGQRAKIEIFPEYKEGLVRIEEHSHFWIMCWFNQAYRDILSLAPLRVNPNLPSYGVFGLRSPGRPNPVGLTLVKLEKVEDNILVVEGLDAVEGTPVIDIKPYYEQDIIFSPRTPYIRPFSLEMRKEIMLKEAFNHHQEKCQGLYLAVRMALIADEEMGHLNNKELKVEVIGSPCLADTLQGLTRARLANPPRFIFKPSQEEVTSIWQKGKDKLVISLKNPGQMTGIMDLRDEELFAMERYSTEKES